MRKLISLLRNINVINIVLTGALISFAGYVVPHFFNMDVKYTLPVVKKSTTDDTGEGEKPAGSKSLFPSDYIIIAEQNLFHPERKIPVEVEDASPLQKPDFVLYGTLITDNINIAYMEDKRSPHITPGRGKRQTALKPGDSMSGFTLKEIDKNKVVMLRGEEEIVVYLNDPETPKTRETTFQTPEADPSSPPRVRSQSKHWSRAKTLRQPAQRSAMPVQPPPQTAKQPPASGQMGR